MSFPVMLHLTPALDVCTHSLVGFRLTLVSETSVDVAMVLRDVTMPLPMRADWGGDLESPYPGLPAAAVAEFAGHAVAGLPFFIPETVTTDHGSVYRNHHLVEVERVLGCQVLPADAAADYVDLRPVGMDEDGVSDALRQWNPKGTVQRVVFIGRDYVVDHEV